MEVSERFKKLLSNLTLTDAQLKDGATKRESVCGVLNAKYFQSNSGTANSFYVGSWGKATRIRPPRDVDVLFSLPAEVYHRFEKVSGNKQSQLLQEIRLALQAVFFRRRTFVVMALSYWCHSARMPSSSSRRSSFKMGNTGYRSPQMAVRTKPLIPTRS